MSDDRLSAWLDDELEPAERARFALELDRDPVLAAELESLARVRTMLRSAAAVEPAPGAMDRIVADVAAADDRSTGRAAPDAMIVDLTRRRRGVSVVAAIAASVAIIAGVVGGVGGTTTLPAIGDLLARHDAAAADGPMPDDAEAMPMDDMEGVGPTMPAAMTMAAAYHGDGSLVHLVYRDTAGATVSVFRQDGDADLDKLAGRDDLPEGEVADMAGTDVWSATVDEMHVAVVDGDGYVWTVVADDDHDAMMVAMADDLPSRDKGIGDRLTDAADVIVRPWRLG